MIFFRDARSLAFAALLPLISAGALQADEALGVACQGRVLPASRILRLAAYSETGAPVIAKLAVEEGAEVKAGDIVAELAALPAAKARVEAARAEALIMNGTAGSADAARAITLEEIELEIASAKAAFASAKLGNSRRRLTDAQLRELTLALAAKEAEVARLKESRPEFLARADKSIDVAVAAAQSVSGDARITADAETDRARAARDLALKDYDSRLAGETDAIGVLKARVEQGRELNALPQSLDEEASAAEHRLAFAEKRLVEARTRTQTDVQKARYEAQAAEARLAQAQALADIAVIKAPISGKILRVHARAGEAVGVEGVAEMGDLSKIVVIAEVAAADLPRVAVGKKAEIRVPGIEKPVTGSVVRVSPLIGANALAEENPAAFKDLRVAPVEIAVDEPAALAGLIRAQVTVRIAP